MGTRNLMALVKQRSILPLPPLMRMSPCCNRFMSSRYTNQSESRSQKQQISNKESIGDAKIRILVKSFSQKYLNHPCFQSYRKVGLPRRRVVYTVLRSPHIDKKSREQFEIRVHKQLLEKDVDVNEMAKMFFWFKRMHFFGAQYEFIFNYKTRLDMSRGKFQCISTKPIIKKLDISNINCVLQAAPFKGIQVPKRIDVMIGTF